MTSGAVNSSKNFEDLSVWDRALGCQGWQGCERR
jgi:hypothetical protein